MHPELSAFLRSNGTEPGEPFLRCSVFTRGLRLTFGPATCTGVELGEPLGRLNANHAEVLSLVTGVRRTRRSAAALLGGEFFLTGDAIDFQPPTLHAPKNRRVPAISLPVLGWLNRPRAASSQATPSSRCMRSTRGSPPASPSCCPASVGAARRERRRIPTPAAPLPPADPCSKARLKALAS